MELNSSSGLCHIIGFSKKINRNKKATKIKKINKLFLIKLTISIFLILNKTKIPIKYWTKIIYTKHLKLVTIYH